MLRAAAVIGAIVLGALTAVPASAQKPGGFPPPRTLGPVEKYGANIQRTMTLLATSTALKRNTIRILFYGQSITYQDWTRMVADDLRRRFPITDLVIENRAISGYHADFLVGTAEADLYPFYPDLVIFHVYGSPVRYEQIIRRLRERTTADILHATDHISPHIGERVDEETDPAKIRLPDFDPEKRDPLRVPWMNHVFLPRIQKQYGTELADVRGLWKQYLKDHKLAPSQMLADGLHLNDHGNYLMAEIVKAHLRYRPELPDDQWKDRVKTFAVGTDIHWKDGKLVLPFDGNRVDLICQEGAGPVTPAAVRIDGKKPSEFPELYAATRTQMSNPYSPIPPLLFVQHDKPWVVEEWRLVVTSISPDRKQFKYKVTGSVTGEDGEGETDKRFVSKSGRVIIDPFDNQIPFTLLCSRNRNANSVEVRWSIVPMHVDEFVVPARKNPFGDTIVTVAHGLPNGQHTLEVMGTPDTPIAAVRVYRPPLAVR